MQALLSTKSPYDEFHHLFKSVPKDQFPINGEIILMLIFPMCCQVNQNRKVLCATKKKILLPKAMIIFVNIPHSKCVKNNLLKINQGSFLVISFLNRFLVRTQPGDSAPRPDVHQPGLVLFLLQHLRLGNPSDHRLQQDCVHNTGKNSICGAERHSDLH